MCLMDFDGRVAISQTSILDRRIAIAQQFFFTRNVEKSGHLIFDQMDVI